MKKNVFLYRVKNSDDRDACAYIDARNFADRFDCNHYFGKINISGPCYCGGTLEPFENIETVLTAEEYALLWQINEEFNALGYGIVKDDERYNKGLEICARLQPIIDKLQSDEAQQFFAEIVASEKEFIMEEHGLTEDETDEVFNEYGGDYQDRAIIAAVWQDAEELAEEYADDCMDIPENLKQYFNYKELGENMISDGNYYELSDGRIVEFPY